MQVKLLQERCGIVRRWYNLIVEKQEELAHLLTAEQGKPLAESYVEVAYAASFVEWFAEEGKRVYGETIPTHAYNKRLMVIKQPVGVAALITPWNFPLAMITRKAGAALAAGCPVIIKPSEDTPLSALALAKLAEEAGFPTGVYNTVTCSKDEVASVGRELAVSEKVAALSFTGSTAVGKLLMKWSADSVKKLSLELGGNAPFIVFDSADVDAAVSGAIASKFRNTGQTCVSPNRFFVQEGIYDEFCTKLKEAIAALKVDDGFADGAQQGPLINQNAIDKVKSHVDDAVSKGAQIVCGGRQANLGGTFYMPTMLTNVDSSMVMTKEETFGPVIGITKFSTEEEAISLGNQTPYGLAGYFYSQSPSQLWRVAEALECGIVGANEGLLSTENAPFGGYKQSGIGREGSKYGIEDYVEVKYICMGNI
jgi:succinate-semialdehyde dehydrogenase/glutarate-semialdehyde dehydrogenase